MSKYVEYLTLSYLDPENSLALERSIMTYIPPMKQ